MNDWVDMTAKVVYSTGDNYSVQNLSSYGPIFGISGLFIGIDSWYDGSPSFYPKIDNVPIGRILSDDCEVFHVIRK
ncbi:hypothetical protein RhiirA5_421705 [Rhizophagus irregularis]|uniref:Uncharacterized protein n=2 Tax=Rhizophagus irregularis TaxID=588596 RepID=A0A2N0PDE3_9GLOM|nr:hypothetical protein GLOIN_2v1768573 [Rhizophagus irregularis DAOM 181602=DAOM 197198]PKC04838.1 hypothetical protein RhiirA5_421705 [Rhizophagus irregularis]POG76870.1 hypothetical protein GLOIN_2v1768573 [Rhizophagus irregularis DAOM 181602=DAOM 197198]|eukprot:XP_025183736.1 hypothetical protein GLOIN_2v1768573 [Rhizophagus irregularis DAOM 181602=DAOM 197198]